MRRAGGLRARPSAHLRHLPKQQGAQGGVFVEGAGGGAVRQRARRRRGAQGAAQRRRLLARRRQSAHRVGAAHAQVALQARRGAAHAGGEFERRM